MHQVKNNLTMLEIRQWAEYRARRGSLNTGRRFEQTAANMMFIHLNSGREAEDMIEALELMPHEDDVIIGFEEQLDD